MTKVTFDISMSLDGFITASGSTAEEPMGKGGERLLKVAGREAAQVEDRKKRIQAPGAARPFRQDGRGKADPILAYGAAVADLDPADLDGTDAGLDRALGAMAVPDQALASIRQLEIAHLSQEGLGFDLDGLGQELTGAGAQDIRQRIVNRIGLTQA